MGSPRAPQGQGLGINFDKLRFDGSSAPAERFAIDQASVARRREFIRLGARGARSADEDDPVGDDERGGYRANSTTGN
jgi:hypothetical protein